MTIVHASFIVFDIPISPTFKEDNFLTESSWLTIEKIYQCKNKGQDPHYVFIRSTSQFTKQLIGL